MDVFLLFSDEVLLNHSFHVQRKSRNIPAKDTSLGPWLQWYMQPLRKAKSLIGQCDFSQGTFLWVNQHFCVLDNFWKRLKILLNLLYITFSSQNVVVHDRSPLYQLMSELFNLCYLASVEVLIFALFQQIRAKHTTFSIRKIWKNYVFATEKGILYHTISFYNHAFLFGIAYFPL